ncbi:MAG: PQQ-dependent dehydrogenase, methanol/ethanol family [Gemmatimonadota bacterium]|nr:PQQ-dependent dehydrogenase, methanol/ethanol family [Gemmatimonadota bacterium]MDE2985843.1 PQQ-dependent dehydrogenase, methanol/ethanol family [Gemmatimonadota bacterium]
MRFAHTVASHILRAAPFLALATLATLPATTTPQTTPGATLQANGPAHWPHHGRDAAETRHSPLDRINTDNISRLGLAWSWEIPKTGARLETTPLVVDGVLYGTAAFSFVFALDAATGEEIWRWDPAIPHQEQGGPRTCCGNVNRGVAMHGGLVYAGLLDGRLVALDRADGSVRWTVQTTPAGTDYTITGAPRIVGDAVVIGNGGADYGVRGYVTAYDAGTGKQLWRTYTVPGNPADGFENEAMRAAAETWSGEWWTSGGGGTVWDAMAVDEAAGLLYIGTGNGSPWNRDHRSPDGGDNLYLSSIMALDPEDGSLAWHYQTTPGDDWDFTATQPLMLLDLEIGGRERQVIAQAPKNGFFYVVDRITGELISAEPFADDLTWATSVDPTSGRPVETPEARYGLTGKGAYLAPGPSGAHNWHPMSYSPQTGLVYLPATNNNYYWEKSGDYDYQAGRWNTGTTRGSDADRPERPALKGPANLLLAWDPAENREAWRVPADGDHGGTMTTAGNLVFWATGTRLAALDAHTGRELWSAEVGRGAGSPVAYEVDGHHYVSVAAGLTTGGGAPRVSTFALDAQAGSAGREVQETHTTAAPEEVGLDGEVLARIGPAMQEAIDQGVTAGIMTLVARRGEIVHWDARGWRVRDEDPLEPDDIFRIYSMTKPVTSVAVMMLVEDGRLSLDDEVASVIPAFAGVKVYQDNGNHRTPDRPMLIRHLLTHTSGLSYGYFGTSAVDSMYNADLNGPATLGGYDLERRVEILASLPMVDDPGDRWNYSLSTDLLGRVVEVVSGQSFDRFLQDRIFGPLGMHDTGFQVPADSQDRFTAMYWQTPEGLQMGDSPTEGSYTRTPAWLSGGGGLVSTASDYLRFCRMLLGGGELDGVRVLEAETVRLMTRNHLADGLLPVMGIPGMGFGLGFAVPAGADDGAYWWSGVANTYFWIDPAEDIIAFAWTQLQPFGRAPVDRILRPLVQQAIMNEN